MPGEKIINQQTSSCLLYHVSVSKYEKILLPVTQWNAINLSPSNDFRPNDFKTILRYYIMFGDNTAKVKHARTTTDAKAVRIVLYKIIQRFNKS